MTSGNGNPPPQAATTPNRVRYSDMQGDRLVEAYGELLTTDLVCKSLHLNRATVNNWLKDNPELKQRVDAARKAYYKTHDGEAIATARRWLTKIGDEGWVTVKRTFVPDKSGGEAKRELKEETVTVSPPPEWFFNRVLGDMPELQALKTLSENEWLPDELALEVKEQIDEINANIRNSLANRIKRD